jgi:predicted nuclease of predicted toxin-antitoxin system
LADLFPHSAHVHDCGLGASDDAEIWQYAAAQGFAIVSKDLDFYDRGILLGSPPKLIWLRTGNCSTAQIESLLRTFFAASQQFNADAGESLLILP